MAYVVLGILRETRPMVFYALSAICFVLSQLAWFLLGKVVCEVSSRPRLILSPLMIIQRTNSKIDGSFIATVLETAAVAALFWGWRSITEGK